MPHWQIKFELKIFVGPVCCEGARQHLKTWTAHEVKENEMNWWWAELEKNWQPGYFERSGQDEYLVWDCDLLN